MTSHDLQPYFVAILVMATTVSFAASWEDPPPTRVQTAPVQSAPQRPATQRNTYPAPTQRINTQPAQPQRNTYQAPTQRINTQPAQPQRNTYQAPTQRINTQPAQPQRNTYQAPTQRINTQPAQPQRNTYQAPTQRIDTQPAQPQRNTYQAPVQPQPQRNTYQEPPQLQKRNEYYAYDIDDLYSQHLDANVRNVYSFGGAYTAETAFGPYGVTDIAEANLEFRLFKFDEFLGGRIDAWMGAHLMYFIENPSMTSLPDALIDAKFDIGQTWRFENGWSTEIRVAPGIYSDVTSPSFGIPVTLNFYFAVNPELSIQLGGTFRPNWDIPFIPNVGFAWQPADMFRLEAMIPKSKVVLFPEYVLSFFGTYEWRNVTYALAGDDGQPDALTLDDMLVTAGVALCPFGDYTLTGEYGMFISREMSADVDKNEAFDLSKESFIRIMLKGSF